MDWRETGRETGRKTGKCGSGLGGGVGGWGVISVCSVDLISRYTFQKVYLIKIPKHDP